tara:strand:- start:3796 stop:6351 length:2556 start_codon:yes stop_codon:yes gene_type:complete
MTQIIVTVRKAEDLEGVKDALSEYGTFTDFSALKRVTTLDIGDGDEAMAMWAISSIPAVTGAINADAQMKPAILETELIFEGRDAPLKAGALRLRATQDVDKPTFNNWWEQPNVFKWRKDSDRLGQDCIIAIIDGGIRYGHPEFARDPSRVTRIYNAYATDFGASNHGTACASFAAGDTIGLAPYAELLDVKVFNSAGDPAATAFILAGFNALVAWKNNPLNNPDDKFVIANISLSSAANTLSNPFGTIVADMEEAGIIPIISAGNDSQDLGSSFNSWPAEDSEYAVGAIQLDGRLAQFSNYGGRVKFFGFGSRVVGAGYPGGFGYDIVNGTSFACPYVCGCLATWLSGKYRPTSQADIRTLMVDYQAFCSEGIYGNSVRSRTGVAQPLGTVGTGVIGRASYFPVTPGDVIVPNASVIVSFGTADTGVLAWKSRVTAQMGGVPVGTGGTNAALAVFFEGPFFGAPEEGPWLDPLYVPTGWSIVNDRVKNDGGSSIVNKFVVNDANLVFKEYWEVQVKSVATGMSVGVTLVSNLANYDEATTGIGDAGIEWFADGSLTVDGVAQTATTTYADGDILMLAFDTATGDFWLGKNGTWTQDPDISAASASITPAPARAAVGLTEDGSRAQFFGFSGNHQFNDTLEFTALDIGAEIEWVMDSSFTRPGHSLTEGDTKLTNVSGGTSYIYWLPTIRRLTNGDAGKVYWELQCTGGSTSYNGYHSLVTPAGIAAVAADNNNDLFPTSNGGTGYRGLGVIWASTNGGESQVLSGDLTYGIGQTVMMCFDPGTGQLWTGVDGVWNNDPSGAATWTVYTTGITEWGIGVQARTQGESHKLISLSGGFTYAIPAGAVALGQK